MRIVVAEFKLLAC